MNLNALLINIILNTLIISPSLWLSGRILVGKEKAKFIDALLTVALGTIIGVILVNIAGFFASIIQLLTWLGLVKHFFDCGWITAFAISILAIIVFIIITILLGIIGLGLIGFAFLPFI